MFCSTVSSNCLQILHLPLFLFVIFSSHDIWFVMPDLVLLFIIIITIIIIIIISSSSSSSSSICISSIFFIMMAQ